MRAHLASLLPPESQSCSNQICGISIRVSTAKRTATKSILRSRLSQPHGRQAASSIGGSKNGKSGGPAYAVMTVVKGGSGQLIFVLQAAHSHDSNASPCHLARDLSTRCFCWHSRLLRFSFLARCPYHADNLPVGWQCLRWRVGQPVLARREVGTVARTVVRQPQRGLQPGEVMPAV
jgi:hypothetical protein